MSTAPLQTSSVLNAAKGQSSRTTIVGFVLAFLGIIAIASPMMVGVSVAILVGVLLTACGLGQAIFAMQSESGSKRVAYLLFGIVSVLCGAAMIAQPLLSLKFMTALLIGFFLISGAMELLHAFQLRSVRGSVCVLFSGLVSLVLAILMWQHWPLSGAWAVGVLIGVKLLTYGSAMAVLGLAARSVATDQQANA